MVKKLLYLLVIMLTISITTFAKNFNVTKGRQDAVNRFYNYWVKNRIPYQFDGVHDCGGLVKDVYRAGNITFKQGPASNGRNSQGMFNSTTRKIGKGEINQLKPGDALFFTRSGAGGGIGHTGIVLENPSKKCNGGVLMGHTSSKKKPPHTKCLDPNDKTFAGAISYAEMVRLNGYTPVDDNGQVITPDGSTIIGNSTQPSNPANLSGTYEISWDAMAAEYKDMIFQGLGNVMDGFLTLLSLLTAIQIMMITIPYMIGDETVNLLNEVTVIGIKFSFYAYIIKNYESIINMMYNIFSGIGSIFLKDDKLHTLDELFAVSMKEAIKVMKLIEQYHFDALKILIPGSNAFDITFWKVITLIIILLMIGYFSARLVFELIAVINQYYLSFGLSFVFFSLGTNEVTQPFAKRPLKTLLGAGLRVTVTIIFASIIFGILQKANFGDVTLDTVKFETMFAFITSGLVMAFLMNKTTYAVDRLNS